VTIDELTPLLEAWYDVEPGGLGLGAEQLADVRNPTLRSFYMRLGRLTEIDTPWWRYGGQDEFLPPHKLKTEDGATIFGVENQGCFVLAALDDANDNVVANGYMREDDGVENLVDIGVPLEECIVTFVLRESIFTTEPMNRRVTPAMITAAKAGRHHRGRFIYANTYDEFWLADDVWLMNNIAFDESLVAPKGAWREPVSP